MSKETDDLELANAAVHALERVIKRIITDDNAREELLEAAENLYQEIAQEIQKKHESLSPS